jgi:hypothetical protein
MPGTELRIFPHPLDARRAFCARRRTRGKADRWRKDLAVGLRHERDASPQVIENKEVGHLK